MPQEAREPGRLFVIAGIQGAGKTTVGRALAEALSRAVFIDGDVLGHLVVSGREDLTDPPTEGALEQLLFRYAGALVLADTYRAAGFDAVLTDTIYGSYFVDFLEIAAPETLHLIVLHPGVEAIRQRDAGRRAPAYRGGLTVEGLWDPMEHETPRLGLWLDTTEQDVEDTVLAIIQRQHESLVETVPLVEE